ncbi:non-ribosomal peptide synthetase [Allosalinactinospora lopnorensis]|uniref:non-ribosomal peptide synthetase n=1 Tax=Allosalinactinospora lopnorensis TaxID=1352348 RepID=UPI000698AF60|nr:non-ribosomal peptide synthetase [Allosalinactinospora lopnorensis]
MSCPDDPGAVEKAEDLLDRITEALSPPESRAWSGNDTDRPVPAATVTRLFRAQVQRSPDELALTGPDGDVSYAELDRHSDVVAAELAARGVGKGTVVGLLADRSAEALAGLWGILKAGAGYLPLDPHHPDSRTNWELDDSRAPLCLVQRPYASRITGCRTLVLDDLARSGAPPAPPEAVEPGDLAYVIYTSGSTGRPKGVQVEHRSLVNYVTWASELYRVDADTRFALFTSLAFDLTGTAVFLPLLAGGSVALVPDDVSPVTLRAMIERSGANALKLTPAHLDLIGRLDLAPDGFRVLVVGGEQLRGPVAAQAARLFGPECRIVNEYGPTEATIGCVAHVFDPDRDGVAPAVPIGTPVANMKSFLLDADRRFVPADGVGELYLAGAQLARGYLGRPDLDRERFVRLADGTRAYRTGDLARILPSGVLEYLGRSDDQVKIRGHRVEPGEVAAALEEHPRVARALVTGRVGGQGQTILCGYVVTDRAGQRPDVEVLRAHLAERLPSYMVPTAIVCVPELPRTVNGKVDVHALPDPFAGQDDPVGEPAEPAVRDDVEEAVAKIWAEILRTDAARIGPDADFHRLGGDSVLFLAMLASVATTVVGSEGQEAFMVGLREMIRTPTLGRVCRTARRARHEGREGPVSAL